MHRTKLLLATLFAAIAPHAHAAESYDNCTGYIDALPATISTQGTWCLRENLGTAISEGNAITVAANNVTIDCNDFKIGGLAAGDDSTAVGIQASNRQNTTIRQCNIRGFHRGIQLIGSGHLVEHNRLDHNLFTGISIFGENNLVRYNLVHDTGGNNGAHIFGIMVHGSAVGNVVSGVFSVAAGHVYGIQANGTGVEVRGNRVRKLDPTMAAHAIMLSGDDGAVIGNVVSAPGSTPGHGIYGPGHRTTCTGNTVVGLTTAISGCETSSGNLTLP